jgi:peptide subunit release factor RF-3
MPISFEYLYKIDVWKQLEVKVEELLYYKKDIKLTINDTQYKIMEWIEEYIKRFNQVNNTIEISIKHERNDYYLYINRQHYNMPACKNSTHSIKLTSASKIIIE